MQRSVVITAAFNRIFRQFRSGEFLIKCRFHNQLAIFSFIHKRLWRNRKRKLFCKNFDYSFQIRAEIMIHKKSQQVHDMRQMATQKTYALRFQVIVILSVAKKKGKLNWGRRMNACWTQVCHYDKLHVVNWRSKNYGMWKLRPFNVCLKNLVLNCSVICLRFD